MSTAKADAGRAGQITVRELAADDGGHLKLQFLAGDAGLDRKITAHRIQKPGLAMTGYVDFMKAGRVQVLGSTEIDYLELLEPQRRHEILEVLCNRPVACFVITGRAAVLDDLVGLCDSHGTPLFRTSLVSSEFIDRITMFLDRHLALRTSLHGVLMDVYGIGVLITGDSGVGKSECALDLVVRGHRLVSDDVVEIRRRRGDILLGEGPELIRHHMELRGLGVINIEHLFGAASIRARKRIELVVRLEKWAERGKYERLGLDEETKEIMGIELPLVRLPVASGRNLSILIEVAARNLILKLTGYHPAEDMRRKLEAAIQEPGSSAEVQEIMDEGAFE
jgi:HPr kinase/phosphorylase